MYYSGTYGIEQVDILRALSTESRRFEGRILWCFSERISIPTKELHVLNLNIRYHEGVPIDLKKTAG